MHFLLSFLSTVPFPSRHHSQLSSVFDPTILCMCSIPFAQSLLTLQSSSASTFTLCPVLTMRHCFLFIRRHHRHHRRRLRFISVRVLRIAIFAWSPTSFADVFALLIITKCARDFSLVRLFVHSLSFGVRLFQMFITSYSMEIRRRCIHAACM